MGNSQTKKHDVDNDIDVLKKPVDGKKSVIDKVLANPIYSEKLKDDPDTLNRFAEVLSTKEELKKSYLTTDWIETIKLYNTIQTAETAEKGKKQKSNPFSSKAESISAEEVGVHKEDEEDDHINEEDFKQASMDPDIKLKNKIKIKLIISEVANSSIKRDFRKFVSPVLSKLDLLPEFGMFHSGLLIGPWLIEWNNSALCVPRKCVSKAALITADLDAIETSSKVEDIIDKLAEVIVEWNIKMGYKDHGGDKSKEANCQDFVHEVLSKLNIRVDFSGPLGEFLKTLREKGTCEMCFIMDAEFREKFKINQKKVTFNTHEDLDKFVANLVKLDPEFETNYKNEWAMLKSFDRSFWLRHYKMPQDKKFAPLKTESQDGENEVVLELGCPFDDPMNTYSIRFVN